ncbi:MULTISPECIES: cation-transporting P-type ATPase [unclassified Microbacterium]|uniref:cation-transporting P-type ATPase n=1 Tax=unclassified Microbacterium TaxID=2609290 RepID=UPI00214B88F8|nr:MULTISPECIES: cation-transporting P-type ATPase [unclassified Microbacterium]MCR2784307.1 cation-transporting P-type ATPase [Microbacterium sp. zg.B96]WIM14865.1 cation-transporting P-type ATPase [Microbacterium sp. zg-B96]
MTGRDTQVPLTVTRPFALDVAEVQRQLGADTGGLSSAEAAERLAVVGRNELPEPPRKPAVLRFLEHFNDTLIYILLGAAVIKAIMADWLDFWVIMAVAIINAVIGFVQEGRAEKALAGIRGMLSNDASARRDGAWATVPAAELVPGDVVRLMPGDKVPADLRLIQAFQLRIDEAALTGESVPSSKSVDAVASDAGVGDRHSMAFSGTIVAAGQGRGIVTATGGNTEIGTIQALVGEAGSIATPLTKQLDSFGRVLTIVILAMAALMLLIGRFLHGMPIGDLVSAAIGFAVAAIPEGLPALVTITLAIGVQQMAKRHAITRKLPAVETLGAVTTVCSDKTGTLTKNEMTVRRLVTARGAYATSGLGYNPDGKITPLGVATAGTAAQQRRDLAPLLAVATLCNDAHIVPDPAAGDAPGRWTLVGEPTEGALKVVAMKVGVSSDGARRVGVVPFDSANKFMATLNEASDGSRAILVKGAPDRLLERSRTQRGEGGPAPLDIPFWEAAIDDLSAQGLRVLAAARRPAEPGHELDIDDLHGLEFLGLWGILDPPRPEAIEAIADCHTAGIRVKMITGDHAGTALAIAREMGLVQGADVRVLTGAELEAMSQDQLAAVVRDVDVYARTSPEHKIRIVRALQSHREVVAMTGDGVNDAPALTRADVGIAMGIKGTEATKEAAEIVLADDNFATIRGAIREGRRIYDNLRKSVVFLLPTNGAQSLVIMVAIVFGLALPLTPVQVLWINMVTAITLSLALAYEPAERGIMTRPPRKPGGSIVSAGELGFVLVVSLLIGGATLALFYGVVGTGVDIAYARTEAVTMLALGQLAYLFNCRFLGRSSLSVDVFRGNRTVWWSAAALIALQLVYTYVPFMNDLFGSRPLALNSWLLPIVLSILIFLAVEVLKALRRRRTVHAHA